MADSDEDELWITIRQAADLLGVSRQAVSGHVGRGLLRVTGNPQKIRVAELRRAKLIKSKKRLESSPHEIRGAVLAAAAAEGVVSDSSEGYSLEDVDRIREWQRSRSTSPDGKVSRRSFRRYADVARYLESGELADLPASFWLTDAPPPFLPPVGVRRSVVQGRHEDGRLSVLRSGLVLLKQGVFILGDDEETSEQAPHEVPVDGLLGEPPAGEQEAAALYKALRQQWWEAWEEAADERRRVGLAQLRHVVRDRSRVLEAYHRWFDRPGDLPPWFFDGDDEPPFDPPTGALEAYLGDMVEQNGETWTKVMFSAGWACGHERPRPRFEPPTMACSLPGIVPPGEVPDVVARWNVRWLQARLEWRECHRARRGYLARFAGSGE